MLAQGESGGKRLPRDACVAIGIFDGVHLGHQHLLRELVTLAKKQGSSSLVITFSEHPEVILNPGTSLPHLTSLKERVALIKDEGVDEVIVLPFTKEVAGMTARSFLSMLQKNFRLCCLVVGSDFALGREREGNIARLRRLGKEMDFSVSAIPPVMVVGEIVSSTLVREALAQGDMKKVAELLGRPLSLRRRVIAGNGRGARLGFPTANLEVEPEQALPPDGVYASLASIGNKSYNSLTYIGRRPTFGKGERAVEVYLFDYREDLYGSELKVDIISRLRPDRKFDNPAELKSQIKEDIKQAQGVLSRLGKD
ncbi:MAG: bifunctional riboflavin kinase/FAD synthetase [Chloroflexota bacterium]